MTTKISSTYVLMIQFNSQSNIMTKLLTLRNFTGANRLYAWGRNDMNQVGVENQRVVLESTVINDMNDIIQMSGGCHHSVFLSGMLK